MKNKLSLTLWLGLLCAMLALLLFTTSGPASAAGAPPADAAAPTPTPTLNQIRLGQCRVPGVTATLNEIAAGERRAGLVMDARPYAVNQTTGRMTFNGKSGRVSVMHMNPFVYHYSISVTQKKVETTALSDFINLLLPTSLGKAVGFESGAAAADAKTAPAAFAARVTKLKILEARLNAYNPAACRPTMGECDAALAACRKATADCNADPDKCKQAPPDCNTAFDKCRTGSAVCDALKTMKASYEALKRSPLMDETSAEYRLVTAPQIGGQAADKVFADYTTEVTTLRDVEADAFTTCDRATSLNARLTGYNLSAHFDDLKKAQTYIADATVLANDLDQLASSFNNDTELKDSKGAPRCGGYKCVDVFGAYALAAKELLGENGFVGKLATRVNNAEEMRRMLRFTEDMKTKEGIFARTIDIPRKFELSDATVTLNRTLLTNSNQRAGTGGTGNQSGTAGGGAGRTPQGPDSLGGISGGGGGAPSLDDLGGGGGLRAPELQSGGAAPAASPSPTPAAAAGGNNFAPPGQVTDTVTIGRPRFALSAGFVYSPLPRRTFKVVKGFAGDEQGNPTGDGSADIVGFGENSSRRLLPMVMLNTRLGNSDSFFFTTGVSAKYDNNLDIEYLFGPSVGLLGNRVLFTGGLYGGKTQNLLPDIAVGDVIPEAAGSDAKLYRKTTTWKPGFSVSYFFNRPPKGGAEGGGGGGGGAGAAAAPAVREEIRIGSIPFNLAVGMIFSTLEQRTYSPVVGLARDRQGNLTNGQTLTRIVGVTSSSDSRLTPAVLLHSRLTDFGGYDFYFTTGVTGKKTDTNFDIEYLLGGSVNLYRRKLFLTFGAFAGKQETLGGNFFEGAALAKTQGVTTQNRYVWKPAFSFSYDVTRFVTRGAR